jgi:Uma2 family endonuclease
MVANTVPQKIVIHEQTLFEQDAQELHVEVMDGQIITREKNMPSIHVLIIQNMYDEVKPFVTSRALGRVFVDGMRYILQGTRQNVLKARKPDFSFVRKADFPEDYDWFGDFVGAPTLALEVFSPGQTTQEFTQRMADYFGAGTDEFWLIYPEKQRIFRYLRQGDEPLIYNAGDIIDLLPLFEGLQFTLDALFRR